MLHHQLSPNVLSALSSDIRHDTASETKARLLQRQMELHWLNAHLVWVLQLHSINDNILKGRYLYFRKDQRYFPHNNLHPYPYQNLLLLKNIPRYELHRNHDKNSAAWSKNLHDFLFYTDFDVFGDIEYFESW